MRFKSFAAAAFLLVVATLYDCPSVFADDWPMFGRNGTRNAVSFEKNPPLTWSVEKPQKNIRWTAPLGTSSFGAPVVADGLVWVGTNTNFRKEVKDASVLKCFQEKDGKLLYEYVSTRLPPNGGLGIHDFARASISSSPLVEKDRLWFLTNRWEVICLDISPIRKGPGQPKIVWKVDLISDLGVYPIRSEECLNQVPVCSICSYKNLIYVITGNGRDAFTQEKLAAPMAPSLVCFEKNTGKIVWQDASPGNNLQSGQWASPTVIEVNGKARVVAPQGDGWVRSFDALTGAKIWEMDTNSVNSHWQAWNNVLATPVFYKNRVYIANGRGPQIMVGGSAVNGAYVFCIDPAKKGNISLELKDANGKAIPNPNSGVVWRFGGKVPQAKLKPKQRRFLFSSSVSTVAIQDDLVIACDIHGWVNCLDAVTGKKYWTHDAGTMIHTSPLIVDGKIFVANEDGDVIILALSKEKKVLAGVGDLYLQAPIDCSPVFANGNLFVATGRTLFAVSKAKEK